MANGEINATDLTEETTSTLSGNEQFVMFDPVEGKRADIDAVATYIAGDKTQLQTTEKNSIVGAINEVNGKAANLKEDFTKLILGEGDSVQVTNKIGTYNVETIIGSVFLTPDGYSVTCDLESAVSQYIYIRIKNSSGTQILQKILVNGDTTITFDLNIERADFYTIIALPMVSISPTIDFGATVTNITGFLDTNDIDKTLSQSNKIADAKATGDAIGYNSDRIEILIDETNADFTLSDKIGTSYVWQTIGTINVKSNNNYKLNCVLSNSISGIVYITVTDSNDNIVVNNNISAGTTSVELSFAATSDDVYSVKATPSATINETLAITVSTLTGFVNGYKKEVTAINGGTGLVYPFTVSNGKFKVKVAESFVITYFRFDGTNLSKAILADTEYLITPLNALIINGITNNIEEVSQGDIRPYDVVLLQTGAYVNGYSRFFTGLFADRVKEQTTYEDLLLHNVSKDYVRDVDDVISEIVNDTNDFNVVIGTDMHITESTTYPLNRPILNVINRLQSRIQANALINLGDNVDMGKENTDEAYYSIQEATGKIEEHTKSYYVVGNHDYNNISGVSTDRQKAEWILPDKAIYNMYGRLHENDVVWGSKDKVYYYKDFDDKKIRMIVLNTLDKPNDTVTIDGVDYEKYPWLPNIVSADQIDWFIDEALDFSDKSDKTDWSVIIFSHVTPAPNMEWNSASLGALDNTNPQGVEIIKIAEAFINGTSKTLSYTDTLYGGSATLNRTADFTSQGAIPIIGWFSGHSHIDTKATINGVTYVTTVCGYPDESIGQSSAMSGMTMIAGTYTAFGIDVLSLDKTLKKVKLHRVGIGNDREWTY